MILLEWDIANVIIFDAVRKEKETKFRTEEEALEVHKGVTYGDDHKSLVMWSIQKRQGQDPRGIR